MSAEWTDEEYGRVAATMDQPVKKVASEIGKSESAIARARQRIRAGWARKKASNWTPDEDLIITSNPTLTAKQLAARLPGRSKYSVDHRRVSLKAKCLYGAQKSPYIIGNRILLARTCRTCGRLLPAQWFATYRDRDTPRSDCRKCLSRKATDSAAERYKIKPRPPQKHERKYALMAQALSLQTATKHRDEYTEADHKVLADPLLTNLAKALILGRTYSAVATKVTRNGYKSFSGIGNPEHDMWLIDNPNADRIDEITASLKQEFETAGVPFPAWDWDDEDLKETAA